MNFPSVKQLKLSNKNFMLKTIFTFLLGGIAFMAWRIRNFIKAAVLIAIIWLVFGDAISKGISVGSNFISTSWTEMRADSKAKDAHKRELERVKAEADAANSKVRAEADARSQVLAAEDLVKQAEWERTQVERHNDAVNDAIRAGTWNDVSPEVQVPTLPTNEAPSPTVDEQTGRISVKSSEDIHPKVEQTVDGKTVKVRVTF